MELKTENKLKRLEACRKVRQFASQTCLYTFQKLLKLQTKVSEVKFRNIWLKKMYRSKDIIGDGWYDPPPNGIGILFGDENNCERVNYPSLRPKSYWPQMNVYFKRPSLGYIFASPFMFIDDVPIIGDFGFTYYLGNNIKIIDHFKKCSRVIYSLIDSIEIGMTYKQLYNNTIGIMNKNDLTNAVTSTTDKAGTNIGHCIPFIERNPSGEEKDGLDSGDSDKMHKVINVARQFINETDNTMITEDCAFTFEPRFISEEKKLPMFSLHTIVQFVEGKKVIADYFKGIFDLLDMQWLNS